ncbi:hypothetical protein SAMN05518861_12954 [Mesorhizobium sp. YR577]|nr:hypothetical protein SAMN05518861_12954 [Mesorhizobium sp. YR577]
MFRAVGLKKVATNGFKYTPVLRPERLVNIIQHVAESSSR